MTLDPKVAKDYQDNLVQQGLLENKEQKDSQEIVVILDREEIQDHLVPQVIKVPLVLQDLPDSQDLLDLWVNQDQAGRQEIKVILDHQENRVQLDLLVPLEKLVL